jgi:hypothetical protein
MTFQTQGGTVLMTGAAWPKISPSCSGDLVIV